MVTMVIMVILYGDNGANGVMVMLYGANGDNGDAVW